MIRIVQNNLVQTTLCTKLQDEDEIARWIHKYFHPPTDDLELIKDRCFGGFPCDHGPEYRHIIYSIGRYNYLGDNVPLTEAERRGEWITYMGLSTGDNAYIGGGPFTHDAPKQKGD